MSNQDNVDLLSLKLRASLLVKEVFSGQSHLKSRNIVESPHPIKQILSSKIFPESIFAMKAKHTNVNLEFNST